jgi:multidrug efflux pump subunit AcrA (membrane-fusion protein)
MVLQVHPEEPIGGQLTAKVSLVERVIDASSGTFGLRLELPNPEGKIPAGLRCRLVFPE